MSTVETGLGASPRGGLKHLFHWWLGELAGLLARPAGRRRVWRTILHKKDDALDIYVRTRRRTVLVGSLSAGMTETGRRDLERALKRHKAYTSGVLLRLTPGAVLQKTMTLPRAAADVMEPVIRNQIERVAPWPEAETRFGYRVQDDDTASDQISVDVVMTSKSLLDEAFELAGSVGLKPGLVDFAHGVDQTEGVGLVPDDGAAQSRTRRAIGQALGAILAAAVAIGGYGFWGTWSIQRQLDALLSDIARARVSARQATRLDAENAELRRRRTRLIRRKKNQPSVSIAIEALSRVLPDSVWLTRLEVTGSSTRLNGQAANAASLITTLENSPHFTRVRFSAPTMRRGTSDFEVFSITAEAVPGQGLED